jgi:hypothetical protein
MEARIGDPVESTPPQPPQPPQPPPPPPPADLARIEVLPAGPVSLYAGDTRQLTVTGIDAQGRAIPNVNVAWQSSNPSAVSVSAAGALTAEADGESRITAAAGSIVSNAVAITVAAGPSEQISIPFKPSKGALRQEVASRLAQIEGARITSIRFQLFQTEQEVELSALPAGLRGGLSGPGTVTFDLTITKRGDMTKAQIEQLCEQLPDFRGAQYSARLEIVRANRQE